MTTTTRYPLDFDNLNKGDFVPPSDLSKVVKHPVGTAKYQLAVLSLKERVETELARLGRPVTAKIEANGIRILTDAEATEYNDSRFHNGLAQLIRTHVRQTLVDISNLTDEQRIRHDRRLVVQAAYIQGMRDTRKRIHLIPSQRVTPKLMADTAEESANGR